MKKLSARSCSGGVSLAFTQNEREEVRYVGTDGNCAVALSAESGSHQQNYVYEQRAILSPRQASEADVQSQAISSSTSTTKKEVRGMESTTPTTTSASLDSWLEPSKYLKPENQKVRSIVRRLTPKECCRLMLIPEDHPFVDGDATSDSSVFKLQGNGWARNQSRWVFKRQHEVDEKFVTGHRKQFKFGTISSGQGTHELSVTDFGDISLFASEIDPFPCRVIAERFPDTVNFGDMTRIDYDPEKGVVHNRVYEGYQPMSKDTLGFQPYDAPYAEIPLKYGEIDVISGGTPCFVAGSMVSTDKGPKPIEEIKVGDLVLTHKGRLQPVEKVGSKLTDSTYILRTENFHEVRVTGNHPFLVTGKTGEVTPDNERCVKVEDLSVGKNNDQRLVVISSFSPYGEKWGMDTLIRKDFIQFPVVVYNIQVAEDHTYVCNGFCVHNCTDVSVAGKRSGATEGSNTRSSLAFTLPRLGNALGARWLTFENVAGILSSHGGKDFGWFLYRVMQAGYTIAWRTLDAQVTFCDKAPRAVPQRRMRIWMVAYRGDDWRIPCRVLFEPMKVLGTEPPRRIVGRGFLNADSAFDPDEAEFLDVYKKKKGADDGARGDLFSMFFGEPEPDDYAHYKPRKLTRAEVEVAFPDEADIRNVKPADMVRFMRTVGFSDKGMYAGPLFTGDKDWRNGEVTPDDLAKGFLENLGTGGIISNGFAATLKMPTWNAGITEEELAEMDETLRELYDGTVCGLSDVLYRDVDGKYRLSWRACWGIIVRAETRGKRLPELLEDALLWQIAWNPEHVKWAMQNAKNEEERGKAADCWKRVIEPNAALYVCPLDEIVPESPKKAEDDSADEDDDEGDETETDEFADEAVSQYCDEGESAEGTGDEA